MIFDELSSAVACSLISSVGHHEISPPALSGPEVSGLRAPARARDTRRTMHDTAASPVSAVSPGLNGPGCTILHHDFAQRCRSRAGPLRVGRAGTGPRQSDSSGPLTSDDRADPAREPAGPCAARSASNEDLLGHRRPDRPGRVLSAVIV